MDKPEDSVRKKGSSELQSEIKELKRIKQQLQAHLSNSPLAVIEFDPFFRVMSWSQEAERLFGWPADEVIGKRISEMRWVHEEDVGRVKQISAAMLSSRNPRNMHANRNYRRDGSVVHCEWYNSAIYDEDGRLASILSFVLDVTERKQIEKALLNEKEQSRRQLSEIESIYASAPVGLAVLDRELRYVRVNKRLAEKIGVPEKDLIGKTVRQVVPGIAPTLEGIAKRVLETGEPELDVEVSGVAPSQPGKHRFWKDSWYPLKDTDGNVAGLNVVVEDITERRRAEEALRESEEKFRSLAESSPAAVLMYQDDRYIYANKTASLISGYSVDEIIGMEYWKLVHPDDHDIVKERGFKRQRGEETASRYEHRWLTRDGTAIWVDLAGSSTMIGGQPAGIVAIMDITERKRAEEALRESEKLYRTLFENTEDAFLLLELVYDERGELCDGIHTYMNEAHEKQTGIKPSQLIGKRIKEIYPDTESCWFSCIDKVAKTGTSDRIENFNISTGRWYNGYVFKYGNNKVGVLFRDVSLRKNAEEQLKKINKHLLAEIEDRKQMEKKLLSAQKKLRAMATEIVMADERSRQHFATDLHDTVVQTMGAAKLRAQLIQNNIPKKVKTDFAEMQDMLSQSIIQARSIMAEMSPPVLYELGFVPALEWLTEQIKNQHGISIDFRSEGAPLLKHETQVLLFQATRELLMNVIKHAGAQHVAVELQANGSNVKIAVEDDGKGVNRKQIFSTDVTGGGFGLFSIRERLKHFDGNLSLSSKPGQGTKVTMTIPGLKT